MKLEIVNEIEGKVPSNIKITDSMVYVMFDEDGKIYRYKLDKSSSPPKVRGA